jgi:hypothetical protein
MKAMMCLIVLAAASVSAAAAEAPSNGEDSLQVLIQQQQALKADVADGDVQGLTRRQVAIVRKSPDGVLRCHRGQVGVG